MTVLGDALKTQHAAMLAQADADYTLIARRADNPRPGDAKRMREIFSTTAHTLTQFDLDANAYHTMSGYDQLLGIHCPTSKEEQQQRRVKESRQGLLDSRRDLFPFPIPA